MSVACTRINDEPLSPSLLRNEEKTNVFNSRFNKLHATSIHQITDKTHFGTPTVLENWINTSTGQSRSGLHVSDLEAYAAFTHPSKNELSFPAVTQRKVRSFLRHPVVEQLAKTATWFAIPEHHQKSTHDLRWHDSRAVSKELPRRTQSEVTDHGAETWKCW